MDHGTRQKIQTDNLTTPASTTSEDLLDIFSGFLAEDVEVKALLVLGMKRIGSDRLKKNLSVLLEDFAERLTSEDNMHDVSQFACLQQQPILYTC